MCIKYTYDNEVICEKILFIILLPWQYHCETKKNNNWIVNSTCEEQRVDRDCSNSHSRKTVDKSYICKQIKPQNTPMSTNHYSKTNMSTPDDATKQHKTTFWYLKKQHVFLRINNLKSCILILTVYQYHESYYY